MNNNHLRQIGKNPFVSKEVKKITKVNNEFQKLVSKVTNKDTKFEDKMELLLEIQGKTLPMLMDELSSFEPNVDKSIIASKVGTFIKEMRDTIIKKREVEISEDINPYSPKFQLIFEFFVELVHEVMVKEEIDEIEIKNFFGSFANEISGWEEKIIKRLRGVNSKTISKGRVENPLIEKFKREVEIETEDVFNI